MAGSRMYSFFSSNALAGGKVWRWRGSEGDLEIESRRGQKHSIRDDPGPREPLCPCPPARPLCSGPPAVLSFACCSQLSSQDITDSGPDGLGAGGGWQERALVRE